MVHVEVSGRQKPWEAGAGLRVLRKNSVVKQTYSVLTLVGARGPQWYSFPWINGHSPCKPICPLAQEPHIQEWSTGYSALHPNVLECTKIQTGVHVSWWLYPKLQDFVCWGSGYPVTGSSWKEGLRSVVLGSLVEGSRHVSKNLLLAPMS